MTAALVAFEVTCFWTLATLKNAPQIFFGSLTKMATEISATLEGFADGDNLMAQFGPDNLLDKPWSASTELKKVAEPEEPWMLNRSKEQELLALQTKIKNYLGKAHLSAPKPCPSVREERRNDLEDKLANLLRERDCDETRAKPTWFWQTSKDPTKQRSPPDETIQQLGEELAIDLKKYTDETGKLQHAVETNLLDIVSLEKELEKATKYIQATHDAIGKLAELQQVMAQLDGNDKGARLSSELTESYDKYMLENDVEQKIDRLVALKQKHHVLMWTLPHLKVSQNCAPTPPEQPVFGPPFRGGDLRGFVKV